MIKSHLQSIYKKRKIIINVKQDNRLYDIVASEQKRGYILSFLSSFLDYSISSCDDCDERKNRKKRKQRTKFSDTIYCSFILWMIGNIIISFFWFDLLDIFVVCNQWKDNNKTLIKKKLINRCNHDLQFFLHSFHVSMFLLFCSMIGNCYDHVNHL